METLKCLKCGLTKPIESFHIKNARKTGRDAYCKDCRKKEGAEYRKKYPLVIKKRKKYYYEKNKPEIAKREKEYRENNKDLLSERHKEYYKKNRKTILKKVKKWTENNKSKVAKRSREWRLNNKEILAIKKKEWAENNIPKIIGYKKKYARKHKKRILIRHKEYNRRMCEADPVFKFIMRTRGLIADSFSRRGLKKKLKSEQILGCTVKEFRDYIENQLPKGKTIKDMGYYKFHIDHIIPLSTARTIEDVIRLCHYTNLRPLWWEDNLKKGGKII